MIRAAQSAVLVAALALFASALAADTDDPWGSDPKTTCWQTAWPLTGLGVVGLVVILVLRGVVISHNEIYYRNPWWRLSWWLFGLGLLVSVVLVRSYCGRPFAYWRLRKVVHDLNREVPPRHRGPARGETPVSVKKTHRPTTAARAKRKLDAECVCLHPYADHRLEHSQIGVREVPVRRLHATQSAGLEPNYFAIRTGSFRPPLMSRVA